MNGFIDVLATQKPTSIDRTDTGAYTGKPPAAWPEPLAQEAFHGLTGDIVKTIAPHTEADPAALLFSFLLLYGNVIGRNTFYVAEADKHFTNLFVAIVGATAKGRKGVSYGHSKRLFETLDFDWTAKRIVQGLSSGEGLIWAVRDEQKGKRTDKQGNEEQYILVDGVEDKRLVAGEAEFASTIRVLGRDGNTLSAVIRKAWDDGNLNVLTKNNPATATGAHISILAHITKDELTRYLDKTESANGFGNRFLWVCAKRSQCLPEGGKIGSVDFAGILKWLDGAITFGKTPYELHRDRKAKELWAEVYPDLSEGKPGLFGSVTSRAEAQVLRLSCIYALLDMSEVVRLEHLSAALACWKYSEDSAKFIFGEAIGDVVADEILRLLKEAGQTGLTRTDISNLFGRHKSSSQIDKALSMLAEKGLAQYKKTMSEYNRPVEIWCKT